MPTGRFIQESGEFLDKRRKVEGGISSIAETWPGVYMSVLAFHVGEFWRNHKRISVLETMGDCERIDSDFINRSLLFALFGQFLQVICTL
jgi:hypothetical protein